MSDEYTFRPRKKRVAVYFNDGHSAMSVECASPNPRLLAAVKAARKEFFRVYRPQPDAGSAIATEAASKEAEPTVPNKDADRT